jgi:hypothetical protein
MGDVTQNISAQLFAKELVPLTQKATYTGCETDFTSPYLTTCVNNESSDIAVENAFQKQLDLSEYYKSPFVYLTMKRDYMSKTMGNENDTGEVKDDYPSLPEVSSTPPIVPVGSRDFIQKMVKEGFGSNPQNCTVIMILIAAVVIYYLSKKK